MFDFKIPDAKKVRVILSTDLKNEVDDQFAMVHALLTQSFDLRGIVPAHFGNEKSPHSQQDSMDEGRRILEIMNLSDTIRMESGALEALVDERIPKESSGAEFIIEEAMQNDERPLYIAALGALTDVASAVLMQPEICNRNVTVIWIGGRDYPEGGWEYNLKNDIYAANVLFQSTMPVWQIPRNVYRMMGVTFAELHKRVYPYGKIGRYLTENVISFNNASIERPVEYRILGDSPAIGTILYPDCGTWSEIPAPVFGDDMRYIHGITNRPIRVYECVDARFILEDFYAKLEDFANSQSE